MRPATWSVGWHSKVVLTIIAVSLVGLLVKELPRKVAANTEEIFKTLPEDTQELLKTMPEAFREGYIEALRQRSSYKTSRVYFLSLRDEDIDEAILWTLVGSDYLRVRDKSRYERVNTLLHSLYCVEPLRPQRFKVKFVTNDFIILESE